MEKAKKKPYNKEYANGMEIAIKLFKQTFQNVQKNNIDLYMKKYIDTLTDMIKKYREENRNIWSAMNDAKNLLEKHFTFGIYF